MNMYRPLFFVKKKKTNNTFIGFVLKYFTIEFLFNFVSIFKIINKNIFILGQHEINLYR